MSRTRQSSTASRRGVSRSDVLVVAAVLILMAAVCLPALLNRRQKVRPMHCVSNMRNIGIAIQNFASSNNGAVPALTHSRQITNSAGQQFDLTVGWPILLLPALDNSDLLKKIRANAINEFGQGRIADSDRISCEIMTCPADPQSKQTGRLSYVVNAGFISRDLYTGDPDRKHIPGSLSWNDNEIPRELVDVATHVATGVMWTSSGFPQTLNYVSDGDGVSTTLLVTENLQAGHWYDTDTMRICFGFPVENTNSRVPFGNGAIFESVSRPLNTQFDGGTLAKSSRRDWQINGDKTAGTGTRPRPSSAHEGGVNVMMCDGSARFLSEHIDPYVYLKLMTSNGAAYGEGELLEAAQY